jgi:hypothetical protein
MHSIAIGHLQQRSAVAPLACERAKAGQVFTGQALADLCHPDGFAVVIHKPAIPEQLRAE